MVARTLSIIFGRREFNSIIHIFAHPPAIDDSISLL
jgi:hypothetical protein